MKEILVRRMKNADIQQVSCLEQQIFSQPWTDRGFQDALASDNVIFIVGELESKIVGYCGMYCALDEGEITNVAVAKEYRCCGIGRKLMEQLIQEAMKAKISNLILEVRVSNASAIHLYEKLGFVIQGVRKGFYEKPKEDGYVMTLSQ